MSAQPLPCPFCGRPPMVQPVNPTREGDGWGRVICANIDCPAQPSVSAYGEQDNSEAHKAASVEAWNRRAVPSPGAPTERERRLAGWLLCAGTHLEESFQGEPQASDLRAALADARVAFDPSLYPEAGASPATESEPRAWIEVETIVNYSSTDGTQLPPRYVVRVCRTLEDAPLARPENRALDGYACLDQAQRSAQRWASALGLQVREGA